MPPISKTNVRGFPHKQAGLYHISGRIHFYTAKVISHDGEGAVATYGRSQQVRPSRVDLRSQRTATFPWRWRPRHRICQPPSRNQSIPAQRTTTGAPSLRQILKCNRKSQIPNYQLSSTYYHLHLYTSTRPFFKSLNAPIPKCNRKSKIINLKFFASASREIWYNSPVFPQ